MSAMLYERFMAGATVATFVANLCFVLYVLVKVRGHRQRTLERRYAALLAKIAAYELVPLGLFGALFVARLLDVLPSTATQGVQAIVIAGFLTLAMIGLVMPGYCGAVLLRQRS